MATIKVRAKFPTEELYGFYGTKIRYDGDEFDFDYNEEKKDAEGNIVPLKKQLGSWMVAVDPPKKKAKSIIKPE